MTLRLDSSTRKRKAKAQLTRVLLAPVRQANTNLKNIVRMPNNPPSVKRKLASPRLRWQEGMISRTLPPPTDEKYVSETQALYIRAVAMRLKRENRLTGRQRDIVYCVIARFSNKEIAAKLNMSRQRVDQHIAALLKKTKEKDKVGLVLWLLGFASFDDLPNLP